MKLVLTSIFLLGVLTAIASGIITVIVWYTSHIISVWLTVEWIALGLVLGLFYFFHKEIYGNERRQSK